jgi:hypothetical protein
MAEELLEAEAIEEPVPAGEDEPLEQAQALPEPARPAELEAWREEVRTVAIAAAGGVVAGAATVAMARAVRSTTGGRRRRGILRRRDERSPSIIASRSFLVDVHLLGR